MKLAACAISIGAMLMLPVSGKATTLDIDVVDSGGAVIQDAARYAEPLSNTPRVRAKGAEIAQKGRKFLPLVTVVQAGS